MGRPPWFSKPTSVLLIRTKVLVLVGVVCWACWLLLVSGHVVVGRDFEERRALATLSSMSSLPPIEPLKRMEDEIGTGKPSTFSTRPATDLNYMSNRKVPNGPDPIHNRRTGNSKQPPRQSQAARP